jgi:hypothetical protein
MTMGIDERAAWTIRTNPGDGRPAPTIMRALPERLSELD